MDVDGVTTSYEYNGLNQLTETECGNTQTVFTYDSIGNQILEENAETGATVENTYAVTGELLSTDVSDGTAATYSQTNVYDHNESRIARNDGSVTRSYYYSNGSVAYAKDGNAVAYVNMLNLDGSVIGAYESSDYRIYLKDMQGSTSSIANQDMSIAAAYSYDDFGQTTELTGNTIENEICYTGALYDKETGLYYLNARYYEPGSRILDMDGRICYHI